MSPGEEEFEHLGVSEIFVKISSTPNFSIMMVTMDREHVAGVVGAAIGQRKMAANSGLDSLRTLVLPFRAEIGHHQSEVVQNVEKLAVELRHRARDSRPPEGDPSATLGRRLITGGSVGSGSDWRAGAGAAALSQMTNKELESGTPGFTEALTIRQILAALARRSV